MKPSELTKEEFVQKVKALLIGDYEYSSEEADKLMQKFSQDVDEGYESATSEEKFIALHPKDNESLNYFRNGNYINTNISNTAWALDLMA